MEMQILQICTEFGNGGIARHTVDLGLWLRKRSHTIFFAGAPGKNMDDTHIDDNYSPLGLNLVSSNRNVLVRVFHAFTCAFKLRRFLKKTR